MKLFLQTILLLCISVTSLLAQKDTTKTGFMDQAMVGPKMMAARHEYNENNMRGALLIYREILETEPNNADAMYGISQCQYHLKKYRLALEYLDKAVAIKPNISKETEFFYGQIYHRTAQMDKAIIAFQKFMGMENPNTYEYELATEYLEQCRYAKEMMAQPVDVEITNLGNLINSRYDDYTPSITSDGKMIVFTSRRNDTKGGRIDEQGDYKYFEDIYYSEFDESTGEWGQSAAVDGELNTETYDAVLSIFPSGSGMYVYKNTVNTTGDIYFSEYRPTKKEWSAAEKMPRPINTSYFEGSVSMTADGNTLYFISERPEGFGQGDIYVSTKKGEGNWSHPKNLGEFINTEQDEKFVFIHPNGKTLYFSSNGHQTMGSYDIFKTELVNGEWSVPINLGYPINTVNEESTFSLTKDNKTLMIAAEYDDSFGERDIYRIDVSKYKLLSEGYESSTYGQLLITCNDVGGSGVKGVNVEVYGASSLKYVTGGKTDKLGRLKINLPGNQNYRIVLNDGDFTKTEELDVKLKEQGETVIKLDVVVNK